MKTTIGRAGRIGAVAAMLAALPAGAAAGLVNVIVAPAVPDLFVPVPDVAAYAPAVSFGAADPGACDRSAEAVDALEDSVVEARAQYWAYMMKQPGFSIRNLTHNPGSEIQNPETRALFYVRLKYWYDRSSSLRPSLESLRRLNDVSMRIQLVEKTCGGA